MTATRQQRQGKNMVCGKPHGFLNDGQPRSRKRTISFNRKLIKE